MIFKILLLIFTVIPNTFAVKCPLLDVAVTSDPSSPEFGGVYKLTNTRSMDPLSLIYEYQSKDR